LDEDGGWEAPYCYYYYEPEPREHDYVVLRFENISNYDTVVSRWRADGAIATNTTRAYWWDGENWDPYPLGVENEGGNNPDAVKYEVTGYITGGNLTMLLQTRTYEEDETCFKVTWADLNAK